MKGFMYQALLVSNLLKDKGFYTLEVEPYPDGLVLFFPGFSLVASFYYLGEFVYRLKIWDRERGWRTTLNYGSINHLVALLAKDYGSMCRGW